MTIKLFLKDFMTSKKINTIVTPTEKKFKEHLQQHLPENIEIHCKVRFADVLHPDIGNRLDAWRDKKFLMMHIDYTLVIRETQEIILAIELDDKSHKKSDRTSNDTKKNEMLAKSKVWYARVPVEKMYDPTIIKKITAFCKKKIATANTINQTDTAPS